LTIKLQPIKTTTINGKSYQISKIQSDTGSWLLFKLMDALRKIMKAEGGDEPEPALEPIVELTEDQKKAAAEAAASAAIQVMLMNLDRDLFGTVQRYALEVCGEFTAVGSEEVVIPVLKADGKFANYNLSTDISTVAALTSQSLYANLSPFFLNGGMNSI
jgi:hypothetical protein